MYNFSIVFCMVIITANILVPAYQLGPKLVVKCRNFIRKFHRMSKDIEDLIDLTADAPEDIHSSTSVTKASTGNTLSLDDEFRHGFTEKLLAWYRSNRRQMPWRGDPPENRPITAYGVWVSEVMLQQTRVETVIAYWNRWMDRFPDVATLAAATPDEVNQMWAGLGYYRRAQNLLKGAQYLAQKHNSVLPNTLEELLGIPGVGPYTAGAIGSIVNNLPVPAVDGNVYRVLGRVFMVQHELGSSQLSKICVDASTQLVRACEGETGTYTQAIMELGATVCRPTNPKCSECPVRMHCQAYQHNAVSSYPVKSTKKSQVKDVNVYVHVVYSRKSPYGLSNCDDVWYLLFRRPAKGLLANQWEFPSLSVYTTPTGSDNPLPAKGKKKVVDCSANAEKTYSLQDLRSYISAHTSLDWSSSSSSVTSISTTPVLTPPLVHVFSHEKHSMYVSLEEVQVLALSPREDADIKTETPRQEDKQVDQSDTMGEDHLAVEDVEEDGEEAAEDAGASAGRISRWLTASALRQGGISTQCKKVLELVEEVLGVSHGQQKKKRRVDGTNSGNSDEKLDQVKLAEAISRGDNAFDIMRRASGSLKGAKKK